MDYRLLFEEVGKFLTERGYQWVVHQVRAELANGRLSEERIKTLSEVKRGPEMLTADFAPGTAAEFVRRDEYTDAEAVVLLLEATRRAICETTVMVSAIRDTLLGCGITQVVFEPERGDELTVSVPLDAPLDSGRARSDADALDALINSIERD